MTWGNDETTLRTDNEFADVAAPGDGAMGLAGFLEVVRLGDHGGEVAALHETCDPTEDWLAFGCIGDGHSSDGEFLRLERRVRDRWNAARDGDDAPVLCGHGQIESEIVVEAVVQNHVNALVAGCLVNFLALLIAGSV